jgi:NurA-like 5'-3' nuclease
MKFKIIFFTLLVIGFAFNTVAQRPRTKTVAVAKFRVPKLTTSIGSFKDSMLIAPQMADSIIQLPLKVVDAKNVVYTISSYQFLYRKIVTTEDEDTGKTSKTTSIKSSLFKTTPLPIIWLNAVTENLKAGEEFLFFAVTVKDPEGRIMYAPNLKLLLK